jgi:hypothetical protein
MENVNSLMSSGILLPMWLLGSALVVGVIGLISVARQGHHRASRVVVAGPGALPLGR